MIVIKYHNKYFKDVHHRNEIWRKFMGNEDILLSIEQVKNSIAYMSKHQPHKLNGEDMEFMEIPLAELEMGLKKVEEVPRLFNFTEKELEEIHVTYEKLKKKIEQINLQRISWN